MILIIRLKNTNISSNYLKTSLNKYNISEDAINNSK